MGGIAKFANAPAGGMSGSHIIFVTHKLSERSLSVLDLAISGTGGVPGSGGQRRVIASLSRYLQSIYNVSTGRWRLRVTPGLE